MLIMSLKKLRKATTDMEVDKRKALKLALEKIEKDYGRGSIMRLGDLPNNKRIFRPFPPVLWGWTSPWALAVAARRVVEIYGPESSGKTTIALQVIAAAQKQGGLAAFVDAEHALDASYAQKLGVNVDDLIISQPRLRRASVGNYRYAGALRFH